MDLVERLIASSCSETCLMGKAAQEIERLRKIEAAAVNMSQCQGHAKQQEMDERIPPEWYRKQMAVEGYDEQNCKNEIVGNREYIQVLEDRTNRYEQEIASLREQLENCMFLVSRIENERNACLEELHAISEALGTDEGPSSVDHIKALREQLARVTGERDEMVVVLEAYLKWVEPLIKDIGMQDMERKARSALAKVGAGKGDV